MLIVHHLANSQSERIAWLCEELALPYELVRYEREPSGAAPAAYKALTAFGTSPVIVDGDLVLGESGAIVEYLCRARAGGRLMPECGDAAYVDYLFWFHFGNGTLVPSLMLEMYALGGQQAGGAQGEGRMERALRMIEARLGTATWFAGDVFTAADLMMCLPLFLGARDLSPYPAIRAYLDRARARPAWRRAAARAEPDRAMTPQI
jgi:glutathione S-transferase